MSIFSIFTSIETFFVKLFTSVKKEYLNLEPTVRHTIDSCVQFGNILKTYLANPSAAGPVWSEVVTIVEGLLGSSLTTMIESVLGEVLVDLGIAETALTDPQQAGNMLLNHLAQFKGNKFADELYNAVKYVAINLVGTALNRPLANILIQFVYDTFFANQKITLPTQAAPAQAAA